MINELETFASAVREANVSRQNRGLFRAPPQIPRYHTAVMLGGFQGAFNSVSWCREAVASRMAAPLIEMDWKEIPGINCAGPLEHLAKLINLNFRFIL